MLEVYQPKKCVSYSYKLVIKIMKYLKMSQIPSQEKTSYQSSWNGLHIF